MLVNNVVVIVGKVVVEEIIDHTSKVRWNLPLDATYVHYRVASILYKIDIYGAIWANKLFPLRVNYNHM
jgi:ribosomal protein S19E (S16A)